MSKDSRYLDIGAGIGLLETELMQHLGSADIRLTAIEPIFEIAQILKEKHPAISVIHADMETISDEALRGAFDTIFCFGVDYLFHDLATALARIGSWAKPGGRVVLERNVFLDMECFFGGKPIKTFSDLANQNPLISLFIYPDQHAEMISRFFSIQYGLTLHEQYTAKPNVNRATGNHSAFDCIVAGPRNSYAPVKNPARALARLESLGTTLIPGAQ